MQPNRSHIQMIILSGLIGLIAIIMLLTSIVVIGTGKVGVITQFGRVTGRELASGIHLKAPFPIQSVTKYDIQIQKEQAEAQAATNDLQNVSATLALNYHLDSGRITDIHKNIGPGYKLRIIDPAVQEVFKAASAKFTAAQLVQNRQDVKNDAVTNIKSRLESRGIIVDDFSIINFEFSLEFAKAIEQKQVAQQNAERANFTLQQSQLDAQAQAAQKLSLTPEILQKMAIEKWDGHLPTALGQNGVFNLPLGR